MFQFVESTEPILLNPSEVFIITTVISAILLIWTSTSALFTVCYDVTSYRLALDCIVTIRAWT